MVSSWVEEQRYSIIVVGCGSSLDESMKIFHLCEQDVVSAWVEEQRSSIIVVGCGSSLDGREYCAFLTSRSDISAKEDLHGGEAYNQHEKGLAL